MHVAITGAAGGIGAALARELASAGHAITLVGRHGDALARVAASLGVPTHVAVVDLARVDESTQWIAGAEAALGPIDVLVNNAGTTIVDRFEDVRPSEVQRLFAVDLLAPLLLTRAVLPSMRARGHGTIVHIASTGALAPNPGMVHYCAAKAGLAAASEALRGELRGTGVHVVTVYPGPTRTAMLERAYAGYPPARSVAGLPTATPEALARRIRSAIERGTPRVIHPRTYRFFRAFPGLGRWLLDRFTPAPLGRRRRADAITAQ